MRTNDWEEPADSRMGVPTDLLDQKKALVQIWSQLRAAELDLTDLVKVFEQQGIRFIKNGARKRSYPKYSTAVAASFGVISVSDADAGGYEETDLVSELIQNPERTIVLEVVGNSMRDAGILPGSILVVETPDTEQEPWLQPANRACVIARINGSDLTVKQFRRVGNNCYLFPRNGRNSELQPVLIRQPNEEDSEGAEVEIIGIVKSVTRKL